MPRPGPRPYECVRRAWHSDRHQKIRGSLIQEIFRLANEVHRPKTRKNKEWQEKLPFVVLKAEEIMYSKANSEAEYMDLTTLWGRANDAIDTIIRKDESTETGDLLQPCIEAALNLGCVPRRASRSQRHNSLRCYLSSGTLEPVDTSALAPVVPPDGKTWPQHHGVPFRLPLPVASTCNLQSSSQQFVEWYSSLGAPAAVNYGPLGARTVSPSQELSDTIPISRSESSHPSVESSDQDRHLSYPSESCTWSTTGCVYPLHYFVNHEGMRPQFHRHSPANLNCNSLGPSGSSGLHTREKEIGYPLLGSVPISCRECSLPSVETSNSDQDRDPCPLSDACTLPSTGDAYPSHHHEDLPNNSTSFSLHTSVGLRGNAFAASRMSDLHTRKGDISFLHNFLAAGNIGCAITESLNPGNLDGIAPDLECDLALRLGPSSVPCSNGENAWTREVEDMGSSSSHGRNNFNGLKTSPSSVNGIRIKQFC